MTHWKVYELDEPIDAIAPDDTGLPVRLRITANCSPGILWPGQRIGVHLGELLTGALTVEQSAQLRALLERAERDVCAGMAGVFDEDPPEVTCG